MKFFFIFKKCGVALLTLLGIVFVAFVFLRAIPGNPAHVLVGERSSPEILAAHEKKLGLDLPIPLQFARYLGTVIQGDFGSSYFTGEAVLPTLFKKFPNTFRLAFWAMVYAASVGTVLGLLAAARVGGICDRFLVFISLLGLSVPIYWVGIVLLLCSALYLPWLPLSGMGDGNFSYLILPAITLGTHTAAATFRLARSAFLQVLKQKHIQTARAKGISQTKIFFHHVLRNAFIPIFTLVGLDFGNLLGGAVLTETVFGWDGIGRFAVEGLFKRDYPVILGTLLFSAFLFVLLNLLVDLLIFFMDPRVEPS